MPGIDLLIAKSLSSKIKKELESDIEQRLKMKLFNKYGLSIKQSIEDFTKFDDMLKEFLNSDPLQFEQNCLLEILSFDNPKKDFVSITIKDNSLTNLLLESLGDKESRKIIEQTSKKPLLISEILLFCKLSQTSGYRKINSLIRNGLLIQSGHELTSKKRVINRFSMFCKKINIEMEKEKIVVKVKVPKKIFESSTVIQTILD